MTAIRTFEPRCTCKAHAPSRGTSIVRPFAESIRGALQRIRIWRDRSRQRYHLSLLDKHLLRDIGVSRAQAQSEVDKPFWL